MKKYFIFAASALALASCSSDDYLGNNPGNENGASNAINFAGGTGKTTRADQTGADAASLLNKKFIVAGFKGEESTDAISTTKVFDHYVVNWQANTAGTTEDNTSDWSYVGKTPQAGLTDLTGTQTIKYWDYGTGQYDFIAFSTGKNEIKTGAEQATGDDQVKVTKVDAANATTAAYTIAGTKEALKDCYIADLVTAYKENKNNKPTYNNEVKLTFRNLTTKVRVALYETIPGYSVKDVFFYNDNGDINKTLSEKNATLFTTGTEANDKFYNAGTATVSFPTVGTNNINKSDYNKAHVTIAGTGTGESKQAFKELTYTTSEDNRLTESSYLGTSSKNATYAGTDKEYTTVLPNEVGTTLTLRVNYTLVANDGSNEEIKVYGASAIIPAIYAQWKPNYAYTYIFKISDNTNGSTNPDDPKVGGLHPITFDAVVADSEDGNQSTITTVATPSITTYQVGHDPDKDEYATGNDIYVTVHNADGLVTDLNGKDKTYLYAIKAQPNAVVSEATIHDALTIGATKTGNDVTGRNGIKLVSKTFEQTTTIPDVNGNNIDLTTEGKAVKFTPEANTYAFVYDITTGAPAATTLISAITFAETTDLTGKGYYNTEECNENDKATGNSVTDKVYYQKITNTNRIYAIKVIKVVANK